MISPVRKAWAIGIFPSFRSWNKTRQNNQNTAIPFSQRHFLNQYIGPTSLEFIKGSESTDGRSAEEREKNKESWTATTQQISTSPRFRTRTRPSCSNLSSMRARRHGYSNVCVFTFGCKVFLFIESFAIASEKGGISLRVDSCA